MCFKFLLLVCIHLNQYYLCLGQDIRFAIKIRFRLRKKLHLTNLKIIN